jgi:acetyl esterase/lipase
MLGRLLLALIASCSCGSLLAQSPAVKRIEDVIYGRKFGMALTMDVFQPTEKANGAGIIFCISGGWVSSKEAVNAKVAEEFTKRGYTVFAVMHGAQPKFTIPEVLEDMHRATRFIRANAEKYGVDKDRLGISGGSAGGHLSLMQGNAPKPGDPKARDVVERESSKVNAVACLFPPTDFLNYGKEGNVALGGGTLTNFRPPFEFWEREKQTNALKIITDEKRREAIGKEISPYYYVKAESPPTMIIHGDKDFLVPLQQAERIGEKYKEHNVAFELIVKKGAGHGWAKMEEDLIKFADWFDKHLAKK